MINPDIPDAPTRHWKLNGNQDNLKLKTAAQRNSADAEYLTQQKEDKKVRLKEELGGAVRNKYTDDEKMSLLLILQLAVATQNTARVNYVAQLASWIDAGQDLLYVEQDVVDSASTVEEVEAVTLDLDAWLDTDPQVVIRTAKGIE